MLSHPEKTKCMKWKSFQKVLGHFTFGLLDDSCLKINSNLHLSITTCIRILRIHCTEEPTGKQQLKGV